MGDRLARWAEAAASRLFGPVFALDATRVGRRTSTFVARWVYLLVLLSVLGVFFFSWWDRRAPHNSVVHPSVMTRFAEEFFWVYVVTQFLAVAALTPAFTAAAITDEKERKTLDFLLITTLTGREIVFGKLAVRFGVLLTLVLAGLPIVALMQFFGGIEPQLLFLTVGMTLITVASLSAVGICASVLLSRTRDAVMLSYGLPVAYVFASLYMLGYFRRDPDWSEVAEYVAMGNPFFVGAQLPRAFALAGTPAPAVRYVIFHAVVALLGFAIAALRLRASAEGRPPGAKPRGAFRKLLVWVMGRRTEARPHPAVGDEPVLWREVYTDPGGGLVQRVFVLGVLAAVVLPFLGIVYDTLLSTYAYGRTRGPLYYFQEQTQAWVCGVTAGLGVVMMLRATVRGATAVAGERDRDTWTSLVCTPLSTAEILRGKWAGCLWGQRGTIALLACVWGVGILTVSVSPVTIALAAVALWVYMGAFAWLGIRCSVTARNARVAISRALPTAIFLGGGFWFFITCCCIAAPMRGSGDGPEYILAALAGITPPAVLAGLPALDSELLERAARYDGGPLFTAILSCLLGMGGWFTLGRAWSESARDAFNVEANRTEPKPPEPPRPGQLEPWDDDPTDDGSPSR